MLDYKLSTTVSDHVWNSGVNHATLPQLDEEFFAECGAAPMLEDTRRRYRRVHLRGRAIVIWRDKQCGVFTIDLSPMGIGFFSPVQFLPRENIKFLCEELEPQQLEIRRCIRTDQQCYNCGGIFLDGPMAPGEYRNFLEKMRV